MNHRARWSRRAVLGLLSAAGMALALRLLPKHPTPAPSKEDPKTVPGARPPQAPEHAARVGAEYLRLYPAEADVGRLRALLGLDDAGISAASRDELAALVARHRGDFIAGRVVRLDGWVLSLTELRLAALIHLGGTR